MKKVLLIVIDALNSWALRPVLEAESNHEPRLSTLRELIRRGGVCWNTVSVFPSITPAATSSIATGCYPSQHGIMGAHYYDREADRVHYFGSDIWVVASRRFGNFFDDFVHLMNDRCLLAPTLFDRLEADQINCGSLNYLIFHGPHRHGGLTPWLLRLWPGVPKKLEFHGPSLLCLGDFVASCENGRDASCEGLEGRGGIWNRFGFSDRTTGDLLYQLGRDRLPQFTLAYFPDNDFRSHADGPEEAIEAVAHVDRMIDTFARSWGGVSEMLKEVTVLITGDHSQSPTRERSANPGIDLTKVLADYRIVDAGQAWDNGDQLMICPNLRVAQIYLRKELELEIERIAARLLEDERVDQVMWRSRVDGNQPSLYHVRTRRSTFAFHRSRDTNGDESVVDDYGNRWVVQGELAAVDAHVDEQQRIRYATYPNALERIAGGFDRRFTGDLWVTAHVGYEFTLPRTDIYDAGGSHGSLHRDDSLSPLIVAGHGQDIVIPQECRSIDIAPLCAHLLGTQLTSADGNMAMFHR